MNPETLQQPQCAPQSGYAAFDIDERDMLALLNQRRGSAASARGYAAEDFDYDQHDGVAIIDITGPLTTDAGSLTDILNAVNRAAASAQIKSLLLYIDSPGGDSALSGDVADAVYRARAAKRVYAYIARQGFSAAYKIASQADRIYSSPNASAGNIGTLVVMNDWSRYFDKAGVKPVVIKSGRYKAIGVLGAEITKDQQIELQRIVDAYQSLFIDKIARGRGIPHSVARALADGRIHVGQQAIDVGLVDELATFDWALRQVSRPGDGGRRAISAAYTPPAPIESEADLAVRAAIAGAAASVAVELMRDEQSRCRAIRELGWSLGRDQAVIDQALDDGMTLDQAREFFRIRTIPL